MLTLQSIKEQRTKILNERESIFSQTNKLKASSDLIREINIAVYRFYQPRLEYLATAQSILIELEKQS